jgi:hypothetical protein
MVAFLFLGKENIKENILFWATQDSYSQTQEHSRGVSLPRGPKTVSFLSCPVYLKTETENQFPKYSIFNKVESQMKSKIIVLNTKSHHRKNF